MKFFVIGGMNLDITGWCRDRTLLHDSNVGTISFSAGGVGRNIARGLAVRGNEVELLTAVSTRPESLMLIKDCAENGIGLDHALKTEASVSCYMSVHGDDGDMLLAVNDMESVKLITPELIEGCLEQINSADACVLDANLPVETLEYAAKHITVPIASDAVSAVKCVKLKGILGRLSLLKLNMLEANTLTGENTYEKAAERLTESGVKRVLISMGAEGAYAADINGGETVRPERVYTCQTNGAGDAMCAGATEAMARGESALECVKTGMKASEELLRSRSEKMI